MDRERFDRLLARLKAERITRWWQRRGCSQRDIQLLEQRYDICVPMTYRWYLSTLGRDAGRLFRHDHLAVTLNHVFDLTAHVRERMKVAGVATELPGDALVILGRLGAYFQFIRCDGSDDSPVWELSEDDWRVEGEPIHASTLDWLEFWCNEAEYAIRSGYFDWLPGGTRP